MRFQIENSCSVICTKSLHGIEFFTHLKDHRRIALISAPAVGKAVRTYYSIAYKVNGPPLTPKWPIHFFLFSWAILGFVTQVQSATDETATLDFALTGPSPVTVTFV